MSKNSTKAKSAEVDEAGLVPAFTLVLWVGCVIVALLDMLLSRPRAEPATSRPALTVQTLDVDITSDADQLQPMDQVSSTAAPEASAPEAVPPVLKVAAPSSALAFEQPVDAPVTASRSVPVRVAIPVHRVQHLTFGQGAGRQPAPEYPREAVLGDQQGTVHIQFTVGENGRVQSAAVSVPCPWPLLNRAALQAVRDTWVFPSGAPRLYDIDIQFSLQP